MTLLARRIWLVALWLYALGAAVDIAVHLVEHQSAHREWLAPAPIIVAVSAGLFWPVDLAAKLLLAQ